MVPDDVKDRIAESDKAALTNAVFEAARYSTQTNIRLSVGGYFIAIFAGRERRSRERLQQDRRENPLITRTNMPVLLAMLLAMISTGYVLGWGVIQIVNAVVAH